MASTTNKLQTKDLIRFKHMFKLLDIFSFVITNFIFFIIILYFYDLNINPLHLAFLINLLIFIMILILNFILLKPEHILLWKNSKKYFGFIPSLNKLERKNRKFLSSFHIITLLIIITRTLFFEILRNFFIITIIWSSILLLLYFLGIYVINQNIGYEAFIYLITAIGIFSGIFQFYFKDYKNEEKNRVLLIIQNYLKEKIKLVSQEEFLEYLSEKNSKLHNTFKDKCRDNVAYNQNRNNTLYLSFPNYKNFNIVMKEMENGDKEEFTNHLNNFFEERFNEVKGDLEKDFKTEELMELRVRILTIITFLDDALVTFLNTEFNLTKNQEKNEKYEDYLSTFITEIYECLFDYFLLGENTNKEEKK